jgi:hypothetical protein
VATRQAERAEGAAHQALSGTVDWQWMTGPHAAIKLARLRYDVGAATSGPNNGGAGSASCAVLEGTLLAEIGSTHNVLAAGSSISYDLSAPHRFSNAGDVPAVGIWGFCG